MLDFDFMVVLLFNSTVEISYASLYNRSSYRCDPLHWVKTVLIPSLIQFVSGRAGGNLMIKTAQKF